MVSGLERGAREGERDGAKVRACPTGWTPPSLTPIGLYARMLRPVLLKGQIRRCGLVWEMCHWGRGALRFQKPMAGLVSLLPNPCLLLALWIRM